MTATDGRPDLVGRWAWGARARRHLSASVDAASTHALGALYGLVVAVAMLRLELHGWLDELYLEPPFHFHYYGFHWISVPPAWALHLVVFATAATALGSSAAAISVGHRLGSARAPLVAAATLGFAWIKLLDQAAYLNHDYLIVLLGALLCLLPDDGGTVPRLTLWVLRFQLGVVYVFAGLAKLEVDWLVHGLPLRIWLAARADLPLVGPWLAQPVTAIVASWAGAAFDLSVVPALCWRRTRALAFGAVLGFHLATAALFSIGVFPWLMMAMTPIFFEPSWPRVVGRWLGHRDRRNAATPARPLGVGAFALSLLWVAVQIVVPLRHHAYPGPATWTDEGFRFGWRVMLVEKTGRVTLRVRGRQSGHTEVVTGEGELTVLQRAMMAQSPDMVLEYAQHVGRRAARAWGEPVAVFASAPVSLNGRRAVDLVDPSVDLTQVTDTLGPKPWIRRTPGRRW